MFKSTWEKESLCIGYIVFIILFLKINFFIHYFFLTLIDASKFTRSVEFLFVLLVFFRYQMDFFTEKVYSNGKVCFYIQISARKFLRNAPGQGCPFGWGSAEKRESFLGWGCTSDWGVSHRKKSSLVRDPPLSWGFCPRVKATRVWADALQRLLRSNLKQKPLRRGTFCSCFAIFVMTIIHENFSIISCNHSILHRIQR